MFDLLNAAPTCQSLALADYAGGFAAGSGLTGVLEASGLFPARYLTALSDALFYCELRNYILYDSILDKWMWFVVNNLAKVIMVMSTAFVTMWVVLAGFKLMSGNNREPVIELMFRGAKIVFVLALVSGMMGNTDTIIHTVLGLQSAITTIVTGSDMGLDRLIDMNIAISQVMNMVVEDVTNASAQQENSTGKFSIFAGLLGQSGPAILTSVLVLLAQIAIVFALMLAPLFVFFLLFKETATLFWSWAKFLLGSFLSLCFLAIVSTIAMSASLSYGLTIMVSFVLNSIADAGDALNASGLQVALGIIAKAFIAGLTGGGDRVEMSGAAMRLAMMGGLFATLIVAVPPMIMQMFNASIGFASNVMGSMGVRPMGGLAGAGAQGGGGSSSAVGGAPQARDSSNSGSGIGFSGQGSGPAGGSAGSNNQMLINAANRNAQISDSGVYAANGRQPSGSAGLASQVQETPKLAQIQAKQSEVGGEFRAGGVREVAVANATDMKEDPITGVFRTPGSAAAMAADPALGRSGHLNVGQGSGRAPRVESGSSDVRPPSAGADTPTHMANNGAGTRVASVGPKGSSVEFPYGKPRR